MEQNSQKRARAITVFATFLAFMGIGVVDPILPTIAHQIGATHWQVEMLFTAYLLTMAVMMIPAGLWASRFGDKRMMAIGLGVVTVFAFLSGISSGITDLSLFRAGWGFGNAMFFATTMTLLIALTPDAARAVGMYEAAIGLGMAAGPLVGGLLGTSSWRYPFFGTAILILVAFLLVIRFVYEPQGKAKRKPATLKDLATLISYRPFLWSSLSGMFYYYGFFVVLAYAPLVIKLTTIQLGLVFFGWGLLMAYGSASLSHRLEKSYTPKQILPYSMAVYAVLLVLMFLIHIAWLQIVLVIASGLVAGLSNALFTSQVIEVSPYERSITSGTYNFVRWIGAAIAPVLSGVLGQSYGAHSPFLLAAVIVIIGIAFILVNPKQKAVSS